MVFIDPNTEFTSTAQDQSIGFRSCLSTKIRSYTTFLGLDKTYYIPGVIIRIVGHEIGN